MIRSTKSIDLGSTTRHLSERGGCLSTRDADTIAMREVVLPDAKTMEAP
jgi:hypothetical protein